MPSNIRIQRQRFALQLIRSVRWLSKLVGIASFRLELSWSKIPNAGHIEAFHFDDNEPTANALAALVLSGQKRATAGLLWTNELTNKPLPKVGALSVVTDWKGVPQCIIETTHIEIVPFESVTDRFAAVEGEGDKTLGYWRDAHWRFLSRECQRIGGEPNLQMPVVCEQFRVVYPTCD